MVSFPALSTEIIQEVAVSIGAAWGLGMTILGVRFFWLALKRYSK